MFLLIQSLPLIIHLFSNIILPVFLYKQIGNFLITINIFISLPISKCWSIYIYSGLCSASQGNVFTCFLQIFTSKKSSLFVFSLHTHRYIFSPWIYIIFCSKNLNKCSMFIKISKIITHQTLPNRGCPIKARWIRIWCGRPDWISTCEMYQHIVEVHTFML